MDFGDAALVPSAFLRILAATVVLTLSSAAIVAALGMLVSLKAPTTQHALNAITLLVICIVVAPLALEAVVPDVTPIGRFTVSDLTSPRAIGSFFVSAVAFDAVLCAIIVARFNRARMVVGRAEGANS